MSGPEQKAVTGLTADGSQILYLVSLSSQDTGGQRRSEAQQESRVVRLMRAPAQGGPSQLVLEAPNIINFQCSRRGTDLCVLNQAKAKEYPFSVFDPMNGTLRQAAKLEETPSGWNDGKGFFISSNPTGRLDTVLYVDLAGNATSLWQVKTFRRPGRFRLTTESMWLFRRQRRSAKVWMVENF